jgi:hypothetical protein
MEKSADKAYILLLNCFNMLVYSILKYNLLAAWEMFTFGVFLSLAVLLLTSIDQFKGFKMPFAG